MNLPHPRRILYAGYLNPGETSLNRFHAFERLGQTVYPFNIQDFQFRSRILTRLRLRFPSGPLVARLNRELLQKVQEFRPEVVWFDKPLYFSRATIEAIRQTGALTVNYTQDNPFGPRNDGCWSQYLRVFRSFDLHYLVRSADVRRFQAWNLPYIAGMFSFDPIAQYPPPSGWSDVDRDLEVSFIGSPYEERPSFLMALAGEHGIPVTICGPKWEKALGPEKYSRYVAHGFLAGSAYREAIWRSKINLSFVTRLNEDDIGHKSIEIAACGAFLMALGTEGHKARFEEDREAVFFSSVDECADKARFYLGKPELRDAIARQGRERALRSGYDNDTQLARVLNRLDGKEE